MTTIRIKIPKISEVEFEVSALPEDAPVRGNASAISEEIDRLSEDVIIEDLQNGNPWAWCTVRVTASYRGLQADAYLGCCSYKSQKDFINNSGHYEDMRQEAYSSIVDQIGALMK